MLALRYAAICSIAVISVKFETWAWTEGMMRVSAQEVMEGTFCI